MNIFYVVFTLITQVGNICMQASHTGSGKSLDVVLKRFHIPSYWNEKNCRALNVFFTDMQTLPNKVRPTGQEIAYPIIGEHRRLESLHADLGFLSSCASWVDVSRMLRSCRRIANSFSSELRSGLFPDHSSFGQKCDRSSRHLCWAVVERCAEAPSCRRMAYDPSATICCLWT